MATNARRLENLVTSWWAEAAAGWEVDAGAQRASDWDCTLELGVIEEAGHPFQGSTDRVESLGG